MIALPYCSPSLFIIYHIKYKSEDIFSKKDLTSIYFCLISLFSLNIASSSNGRTADSDSVNLGSSPGEAANKMSTLWGAFFVVCFAYGEEPSGLKLTRAF